VTSGIISQVQVLDFDTQYHLRHGANDWVVGGGYRVTRDEFIPGPHTVFLDPSARSLSLANLFVQDELSVTKDLSVTLGLKAEHNSYTGLEWMPNARLAWRPWRDALLWAAVSRAVRTPSRFDRDLINPGLVAGGPDFDSESVIAYEVGYRGQPMARVSVSVSAYYNVYKDLRTVEASGPTIFPLVIRNGMEGDTYGVEAWGDYALTDWWRLGAGYSFLHKDLTLKPGSADVFGVLFAGNDPEHQAQLHSHMDLPARLELDMDLRAVSRLPSPVVPGYAELNARLGWRMSKHVELSLNGENLLHDRHEEFVSSSIAGREISRSVYAAARWSF
jgi:iron complex outermembrane receptor protein